MPSTIHDSEIVQPSEPVDAFDSDIMEIKVEIDEATSASVSAPPPLSTISTPATSASGNSCYKCRSCLFNCWQ